MVHEIVEFKMFKMTPIHAICTIIFLVSVLNVHKVASDSRIIELSKKCQAIEVDKQVVLQYQVPSSDTGKCLMLCFLKELQMLDSNGKYDEVQSFTAFKNFWSHFSESTLKAVNSAAAKFAKETKTGPGTCEYGYEIMKFINAEFIRNQLLTTPATL